MPLFLKKQLSVDTVIGVWQVTESYEELISFFPDSGYRYADQMLMFKSERRRKEFIAVRVLLLELMNEQKEILYYFSGKPYFGDNSGNISISHTKGYVAVMVSKTFKVGIDIEKYSEKINRVAHKFIRQDEEYPNHPIDRTTRSLLIWSAKEVLFKCLDTVEVDFLEHLRIIFPTTGETVLKAVEYRTAESRKFEIFYLLHEDFVMTWTYFI